MIINALIAIVFPPNIKSSKAMTGQERYHQSFSYLVTSPSMIGKLRIAEIIIIKRRN